MQEKDDIVADIKLAMEPEETEDGGEVLEEVEKPSRERDESGRFKAKEETDEPIVEAPKVEIEPPPAALSAAAKAQWANLPPDVRQDLIKREADIHKQFTTQDEERKFAKEMREVVTPYMAIIQAEGGTPSGAVRDLLNTAYQLRTGNPMQKAALLHQVAQQYGVDLNAYQPGRIDPNLAFMQNQFQQIQQSVNPDAIKKQLREEMEMDRINSEIEAFKANPKNTHFEQVKTRMGSLLDSGAAKDLQDAYDQACWADPTIRSTLQQAQLAEQAAKRKAENESKRKAGASVNGSQTASPSKAPTNNSIEDDIRAALKEHSGTI